MSQAQYPQLGGPFTLRQQYIGQPARAHLTASQSVLGGLAANVIKLDTITFDPYASSFNLASNGFVPPATGYYHFKAGVNITGSIIIGIFELMKNNVEITRLGQNNQLGGANNAVDFNGGDIVFGTPADLFTISIPLSGAATMFVGVGTARTFLAAQLLA